jgi:hypothetical protein
MAKVKPLRVFFFIPRLRASKLTPTASQGSEPSPTWFLAELLTACQGTASEESYATQTRCKEVHEGCCNSCKCSAGTTETSS